MFLKLEVDLHDLLYTDTHDAVAKVKEVLLEGLDLDFDSDVDIKVVSHKDGECPQCHKVHE